MAFRVATRDSDHGSIRDHRPSCANPAPPGFRWSRNRCFPKCPGSDAGPTPSVFTDRRTRYRFGRIEFVSRFRTPPLVAAYSLMVTVRESAVETRRGIIGRLDRNPAGAPRRHRIGWGPVSRIIRRNSRTAVRAGGVGAVRRLGIDGSTGPIRARARRRYGGRRGGAGPAPGCGDGWGPTRLGDLRQPGRQIAPMPVARPRFTVRYLQISRQALPSAIRRPAPITFVDGLPWAEPRGQIAPGHPGPGVEQHPVDHPTMLAPPATASPAGRQQWLQKGPFGIRQIPSPHHTDSVYQDEPGHKIRETEPGFGRRAPRKSGRAQLRIGGRDANSAAQFGIRRTDAMSSVQPGP